MNLSMQNSEIISLNFWQILISLSNLVILFLVFKRLLFAPVKRVLAEREEKISNSSMEAEKSREEAEKIKKEWENKLAGSEAEAGQIRQLAEADAKKSREEIIKNAEEEAEGIVSRAHLSAWMEKKKAREEIKKEIADITVAAAEKLLKREINREDHRRLFTELADSIGESNDKK